MILRAQVEHVAHLCGLAGKPRDVEISDPHQALRVVKGQRAQQERVHHAEERGTGADAQSHNEDGEGGEARIAAQRAKTVAQVFREAVRHTCLYSAPGERLRAAARE